MSGPGCRQREAVMQAAATLLAGWGIEPTEDNITAAVNAARGIWDESYAQEEYDE